MTIEQLLALGFSCNFGQIDKDRVNYGFFTAEGVALTPEGEALAKSLVPAVAEAAVPHTPKRRAKVVVENPIDPVDDDNA